MSRKTFVNDPDFILQWEKINDQLFVHIEIVKASKAMWERVKAAWLQFQAQAYFEGYEDIYTYTRDERTVRMIGGAHPLTDQRLDRIPGWRMFKWELK